jgi:nitrite reductase/ring-hydroxylating ferredoxin subunit
MSFLSGPRAAGGRLGLIAYEGSGVEDARNLSGRARLPFRGVMALAFECADVDRAYARALDLGAREDRTPEERDWDPSVRKASSVLSPDGVRLEFIEPRVRIDPPYGDADAGVGVDLDELAPPSLDDVVSVDSEFDVCEAADLADGAVREFRPKGSPRIAVARLGEEIFAFEDRCPHLGAPLSRGEFRGRVLVCPWHAWSIDVPSGHVVGGGGLHVRHCSARIVNGRIRVGARHRGPA